MAITWLAHPLLGSPEHWFGSNPIAHVVQIKLGLLALTGALAVHARLRVIPRLSDESLLTRRPNESSGGKSHVVHIAPSDARKATASATVSGMMPSPRMLFAEERPLWSSM